MPFPLAHPAAVMPLRRFCPRWLSLPALIIGSLTPDAGYLFGEKGAGGFSHGFLGTFGFCLPAGILMVALFYWLRRPVVRILPAPYRRALLPLCQQPPRSPWAIIASLLIGTWTHLLWDSFTHTTGWFVQHLPLLQSSVAVVAGHQARVCHLLWYGCSFAGVVWLFWLFEKWKQSCLSGAASVSGKAVMRDAVLVAFSVVPIELVHHLIRLNRLGMCLLAVACGLLVIGIVLRVANSRKDPAATEPAAEGREVDSSERV
jgi:hypothetical protein